MNWGRGLALVFLIFAVFIIYFVVRMTSTNAAYTPDNYYEKGLNYQKTIESLKGVEAFGIELTGSNGHVQVQFTKTKPDSGWISLTWAPDHKLNSTHFFQKADSGIVVAPVLGPSGYRNIRVDFYFQENKYIFQKRLWVN
jgi:FixH